LAAEETFDGTASDDLTGMAGWPGLVADWGAAIFSTGLVVAELDAELFAELFAGVAIDFSGILMTVPEFSMAMEMSGLVTLLAPTLLAPI
jgi:hypothetical protein